MRKHPSCENSATSVVAHVQDYLSLLEQLRQRGSLGELVLYPAIGVDAFPSIVSPVVGLNHWQYEMPAILEHLSPIISGAVAERLRHATQRLTYIHHVDLNRFDVLKKAIEPWKLISPKSLLLKGLFDSVFQYEWDLDSERYYRRERDRARCAAREWLHEMVRWLSPGDKILVCDAALLEDVSNRPDVQETWRFAPQADFEVTSIYSHGVPVLHLARSVYVFHRL
jgi:hypothetical protein